MANILGAVVCGPRDPYQFIMEMFCLFFVAVSSPMSIARVETMRMLNKSQSLSLSSISSLDDAHISFSVANSANSTASAQEPVVSIEELRLQLNSCFT